MLGMTLTYPVEMADRLESNLRDGILPTKASSILLGPEVVWGGGLTPSGSIIVPVLVVLVVVAPVVEVDVGVCALVVLAVVTLGMEVEVGVYVGRLVLGLSPRVLSKVERELVGTAPDTDVCVGRLELKPSSEVLTKCEVELAELPSIGLTVELVLILVLGLGDASVPGKAFVGAPGLCTGSTEL